MDVNATWVPHALQSIQRILAGVRALGFSIDSLAVQVPELTGAAPLARYARDSLALRRSVDAWRGAWRHFLVRLGPTDVRTHVRRALRMRGGTAHGLRCPREHQGGPISFRGFSRRARRQRAALVSRTRIRGAAFLVGWSGRTEDVLVVDVVTT